MGTRYRYFTPDGPPNNGIPPGLEPSPETMFCSPFQFGGPFQGCGPVPIHPSPPGVFGFGMHLRPSPPDPSPIFFFSSQPGGPPPPYSQIAQPPWVQPPRGLPVCGRLATDLASECPPPGARVNGEIAKFNNKQGHIHSKRNTTFHVALVGSPSALRGWNGRFAVYTCSSSMPIDEFIEQIGAVEKAPPNTAREFIGIQEEIEEGEGCWRAARQFRLGDAKLTYQTADNVTTFLTLEQLGWTSQRGQAGRGKPVIISLLPQY